MRRFFVSPKDTTSRRDCPRGNDYCSVAHLAVGKKVAAATQNQALAALLFLYRDVLGITLEWLDNVVRAKKPVRLPVVLTRKEVMAVLSRLHGPNRVPGRLVVGGGRRV